MQSIQAFTFAIFMATFALAMPTITSTFSVTNSMSIPTPAPTTANNTASSTPLVPNSAGNTNNTKDCSPCYCEGETWDDLGTWDQINHELQNSGVVRVTSIPAGYHVNDNITVSDHCFVFEIGVNKGNAYDLTPQKITDLLSAGCRQCTHGGRWDLNFVGPDGGIQGKGWVKADPQRSSDCS